MHHNRAWPWRLDRARADLGWWVSHLNLLGGAAFLVGSVGSGRALRLSAGTPPWDA